VLAPIRPASLAQPDRPTSARHIVIAFAAALGFIAYLDRACISQAAPMIVKDLHLTSLQMGYVFSAFGLSYAPSKFPAAGCWIALERGWCSRAWCSAGRSSRRRRLVWSFGSLFLTRLLFGAGEAGCFPGLAKVYSIWIPRRERPMAEGLKSTSTRWGAAVAPSMAAWLYLAFGWRKIFYLFGALGVVWAVLFFRWYRDHPRDHPGVNLAEREIIESDSTPQPGHTHSTPWRAFLGSGSAWALCVQWFCHYYGFLFLRHLAAYLPAAGTRHETAAGRAAGGSAHAVCGLWRTLRRLDSRDACRAVWGRPGLAGRSHILPMGAPPYFCSSSRGLKIPSAPCW
jgi:Sugar phosphate permease